MLRHPAGLDDTLGDLAWNVAMSDHVPPVQTEAVGAEIIEKTDAQIAVYERIRTQDIAEINALAVAAGVPAIVEDRTAENLQSRIPLLPGHDAGTGHDVDGAETHGCTGC